MAHCAVIRRFVSISRRGLPLQRPDIPHHKHQNPSEGVEDAIDREFNDLFDQWRRLTNEILSEPTERYEIGESVLLGKAIPYPAQVNSVIGVYMRCMSGVFCQVITNSYAECLGDLQKCRSLAVLRFGSCHLLASRILPKLGNFDRNRQLNCYLNMWFVNSCRMGEYIFSSKWGKWRNICKYR